MKKIYEKLVYIITVCLLLTPTTVLATDLTVSDNGSGSSNQINLNQASSNNTDQQNTASIQNTAGQDSNTGNNTASTNTDANTQVNTGDASSDTTLKNSTNQSVVTQSCPCPQSPSSATISSNGSGSQNNISVSTNNNTQVNITQNATGQNNIQGSSNTGLNSSNSNIGNTSINTGNVNTFVEADNENINNSAVSIGSPQNSWQANISGNGAGSTNAFQLLKNQDINVTQNNSANFLNKIIWEVNTGGNLANSNLGNVSIQTGDVLTNIIVKNTGNSNILSINCCFQLAQVPPITPPTLPPLGGGPGGGESGGGGSSSGGGGSSSSSSGSSGGGGPGGEVLGASIGGIMPETGSSAFWWLTLFALIELRVGLYLKYQKPINLEKIKFAFAPIYAKL